MAASRISALFLKIKKHRCFFFLLVLFSCCLVGECQVSTEETDSSDSVPSDKKSAKLESVFEAVIPSREYIESIDTSSVKKSADAGRDEPERAEGSSIQDQSNQLFSLTSVLKTLLTPVIEEFEVGEDEKNKDSVSKPESSPAEEPVDVNGTVTSTNETVSDNSTTKNETDSGKKYKFNCIGRNVTENMTLEVQLVNSTILLEVLSFDKNRTSGDCVLVMFYAPWCRFCAKTAPHYNALARAYPQLEVLAVDAVHFSNLNARFGTVAVPNVMLFHKSRSAVRFNHTERVFESFVQFIHNVTGLEANSSVNLTEVDFLGPLPSTPTVEADYLLLMAWMFVISCSSYMFINSQYGQQAINRVRVLWQEHQHIE